MGQRDISAQQTSLLAVGREHPGRLWGCSRGRTDRVPHGRLRPGTIRAAWGVLAGAFDVLRVLRATDGGADPDLPGVRPYRPRQHPDRHNPPLLDADRSLRDLALLCVLPGHGQRGRRARPAGWQSLAGVSARGLAYEL